MGQSFALLFRPIAILKYCAWFTLSLFIAGTPWWVHGWLASAQLLGQTIAGGFLLQSSMEMIRARHVKHDESQIPPFEKNYHRFRTVLMPTFLLLPAVEFRFFPKPTMHVPILLLGYTLSWSGFLFALCAMRENRHFEPYVRIQEERGHQVIKSGPYKSV